MAPTVQCEEKEVAQHFELSSQEKAELAEMIKDAKSSRQSEHTMNESNVVLAANQHQNMVEATALTGLFPDIILGGVLKNGTKGSLTVFNSKLWAGCTAKGYPNPLNSYGIFGEISYTAKGIMSAVVYAGKNSDGVECGWLLAWADSKTDGKKVYAECGHIEDFEGINWVRIMHRLEASTLTDTTVYDKLTGTSVHAKFYLDYYGATALLGVFNG